MTSIAVDGLIFKFPSAWRVSKYDEWCFYRNQFQRIRPGIKAMDLLADGGGALWLIEVKDYQMHRRTKPSEIGDEILAKVLDTLAALLPASANGNDSGEVGFARAILGRRKLRVVLHLEQPAKSSKLFPRAFDPVTLTQKLRRLLKPIDPHPFVAESTKMGSLSWDVKRGKIAPKP